MKIFKNIKNKFKNYVDGSAKGSIVWVIKVVIDSIKQLNTIINSLLISSYNKNANKEGDNLNE